MVFVKFYIQMSKSLRNVASEHREFLQGLLMEHHKHLGS
jgi:hypothetical protein